MVKPVRIQLSRRAGFRLQEVSMALNGLPAKKICRPSDFGNPYRIEPPAQHGRWKVFGPGIDPLMGIVCANRIGAQQVAVERFKAYLPHDSTLALAARRILRGHNLACFCRSDWPCHVDWTLEVANA